MAAENLNELKKQVFFDMLNLAGRVFIVVRYSEGVVIGNRGFLPEEKEKGLVLVFNRKMHFQWDDSGITAKLVFGSAPQECFVPQNDITSVFSPELLAQFTVSPEETPKAEDQKPRKKEKTERFLTAEKVVKVDFTRKR